MSKRRHPELALLFTILIGSPCWAGGSIILVPSEFSSIQDAIDAASDGDTIEVSAGTYAENLDFGGKLIAVVGVDGAASTTIDGTALTRGPDLGSVVTFTTNESNESILRGFTLTNGTGTLVGSDRVGGAIYVNAANPTLEELRIIGNSADLGGGLATLETPAPTMTACRVEDNNATNGGGLYSEGSTPIVGSSAFIGNTADKGAGAYFFFLASATLTNVTFSTNTATSQGGGLYIELFSNVSVLNCILWNDSATSSAEIFVNGSSPILDTCVIEGGWTGLGQDNADVDPQFESPMTGDFTPAIGSPAINVGDNDAAFLPTIDCAGNTRVICTVVDLGGYEVAPPAGGCPLQFIRGDCDSDGQLSIGDPIRLLGTLAFSGSVECSQACDANADDAFDVADAVYTLSTLFVPGSPPPANPFPDCGLNPSTSPLSCDTFSSCP